MGDDQNGKKKSFLIIVFKIFGGDGPHKTKCSPDHGWQYEISWKDFRLEVSYALEGLKIYSIIYIKYMPKKNRIKRHLICLSNKSLRANDDLNNIDHNGYDPKLCNSDTD